MFYTASFTSEAEEAMPLVRGGRHRLSGPPRGRPADGPPRDDAGGRLRRASLLYAKAEALGNSRAPRPRAPDAARARRAAAPLSAFSAPMLGLGAFLAERPAGHAAGALLFNG